MYIFPMLETQEAIKSHVKDSENVSKLLHLEALLGELLRNVRREVIKQQRNRQTEVNK